MVSFRVKSRSSRYCIGSTKILVDMSTLWSTLSNGEMSSFVSSEKHCMISSNLSLVKFRLHLTRSFDLIAPKKASKECAIDGDCDGAEAIAGD